MAAFASLHLAPRYYGALALALLVASCGAPATDPSGASPSEARQLNEAAAMLDNDSVSANAIADPANNQE
ncbi:MAG: hypothetical protein B7Y43_12885 [Sphingomonas sp. 28-62-20]|uniref:hypothetical protein n=1 Tax=Sphingomonas sp. 28-62-20 TaxID=1970433 RepID=UPI000BDB8D8F|nr:MAG: hypothetical protein B7Y43_12885 [Sphingomonas sp. 28-62-20]